MKKVLLIIGLIAAIGAVLMVLRNRGSDISVSEWDDVQGVASDVSASAKDAVADAAEAAKDATNA